MHYEVREAQVGTEAGKFILLREHSLVCVSVVVHRGYVSTHHQSHFHSEPSRNADFEPTTVVKDNINVIMSVKSSVVDNNGP